MVRDFEEIKACSCFKRPFLNKIPFFVFAWVLSIGHRGARKTFESLIFPVDPVNFKEQFWRNFLVSTGRPIVSPLMVFEAIGLRLTMVICESRAWPKEEPERNFKEESLVCSSTQNN